MDEEYTPGAGGPVFELEGFGASESQELIDLAWEQELIVRIPEAMALFEGEVVPQLNLGSKTSQALQTQMSDLRRVDGAIVIASGRASGYGRFADDAPMPSKLVIGAKVCVEAWANLANVASRAGIVNDVSAVESRRLATCLVVWHELGHAVQRAFEMAASGEQAPGQQALDYRHHALKLLGSQALPFPETSSRIKQAGNGDYLVEGFAEGLAQGFLTRYVAQHHKMSPDQTRAFSEALKRDRSADHRIIMEVLQRLGDDPEQDYGADLKSLIEQLSDAGLIHAPELGIRQLKTLGYGNPISTDSVVQVTSSMS